MHDIESPCLLCVHDVTLFIREASLGGESSQPSRCQTLPLPSLQILPAQTAFGCLLCIQAFGQFTLPNVVHFSCESPAVPCLLLQIQVDKAVIKTVSLEWAGA